MFCVGECVTRRILFRDEREIGKLIAMGEEGDGALSEVRNSRAVTITKRVQDKLTGRDFENEADPLDIDSQARARARCCSERSSNAHCCRLPASYQRRYRRQISAKCVPHPFARAWLPCCRIIVVIE